MNETAPPVQAPTSDPLVGMLTTKPAPAPLDGMLNPPAPLDGMLK